MEADAEHKLNSLSFNNCAPNVLNFAETFYLIYGIDYTYFSYMQLKQDVQNHIRHNESYMTNKCECEAFIHIRYVLDIGKNTKY